MLGIKSPRLKEKLVKEYSQKDKEVKRRARKGRRNLVESLAIRAEEAAERQDVNMVYRIAKKKLTGSRRGS